MKLILLIINIIYVLGYIIPQNTCSSKSNDNVSILSHFIFKDILNLSNPR